MKKLLAKVNSAKNGFDLGSEYNRALLREWMRNYSLFEIRPRMRGSNKQVRYLEGAVIPAYVQEMYGLNPRNPADMELGRTIFKQDFNYQIVKDKNGNLRRVARSLQGRHREVLDRYTDWAQENGAPIPNEKLYKTWSDEYSMELRWNNYWDWLDALGLAPDAMPSKEAITKKIKDIS